MRPTVAEAATSVKQPVGVQWRSETCAIVLTTFYRRLLTIYGKGGINSLLEMICLNLVSLASGNRVLSIWAASRALII